MEYVRRPDENENAKRSVREMIKPVENDDKRDRQNGTGKLKLARKGSSGTKNETYCSLIMYCNYITEKHNVTLHYITLHYISITLKPTNTILICCCCCFF